MRITLVRHGETTENAAGIVQGQMTGRLSNRGRAQSTSLSHWLRGERFDAVYSSDLERAIETAKIIMERQPSGKIIEEPRLREQGFGVLEGQTVADFMKKMKKAGADFSTFRIKEGEDPSDFRRRVTEVYQKIQAQKQVRNVLLVTHYGVINALLKFLVYNDSGSSPDRRILNGSITIIRVNGPDAAEVETENNVDHLKENVG